MIFLLVLSLYLLLHKKVMWSVFAFLLSIGTKFATIFLLPIFVALVYTREKISENLWNLMMISGAGLMFLAVLVASYRSNYQPWYLLFVIPLVSLSTKKNSLFYPLFFLSIVSLSNYIPYLYTGTWTDETMRNLFWVNSLVGFIGVMWSLLLIRKNYIKN